MAASVCGQLADLQAGVLLGLHQRLRHALALLLACSRRAAELVLQLRDGGAVVLLALVELGVVLARERLEGGDPLGLGVGEGALHLLAVVLELRLEAGDALARALEAVDEAGDLAARLDELAW